MTVKELKEILDEAIAEEKGNYEISVIGADGKWHTDNIVIGIDDDWQEFGIV